MPRKLSDMASLARASRAHIQRAEMLGKSLDVRLKAKKAASDEWTPDEDWRRDFASVTTTLQHAGNSLIRALEGNKKDLGGLTEEQLEAQFAAELVAAAQHMTDEQFAAICAAREKKAR